MNLFLTDKNFAHKLIDAERLKVIIQIKSFKRL